MSSMRYPVAATGTESEGAFERLGDGWADVELLLEDKRVSAEVRELVSCGVDELHRAPPVTRLRNAISSTASSGPQSSCMKWCAPGNRIGPSACGISSLMRLQ